MFGLMRWRVNITVQLLGYLLAASIVPLVLLGLTAFEISKRIVISQAESENARLVGSLSAYLHLYNDQVDDLAANIAGNEAIGLALRQADLNKYDSYEDLEMRVSMGRILNSYVRVKGLVAIDLFSSGGEHFHVGETLDVAKVSPEVTGNLMNEALHSTQPTLWAGIRDNLNARSQYHKVISVVRAILHFSPASGKSDIVGVMVISLNDDIMRSFLKDVPLGAGAQMMEIDRNGNIALHSNSQMFGQALAPQLLQLIRNGEAVQQLSLDNTEVLMNVLGTDSRQQQLVVFTPRKLLTQKVNQLAMATFLLIVFGLMIILALVWNFERSIVRSIRAVSDGFLSLERDPQARHDPLPFRSSQDEIGQLVNGYNKHLTTLQAQRSASEELQRSEAALRNTETQLRENEAHRRAILDEMPVGVILIDRGDRIFLRNRRYLQLFSYSDADVPDMRSWWRHAYPDALERRTMRQQLAAQRHEDREGRIYWAPTVMGVHCADGEVRYTELAGLTTDSGLIVTFVDHTPHRLYQQQLELAKADAESANLAKSRFLANMSHEIRTPMNAILGMLNLMQRTELTSQQEDYVNKTESAARSLLGLLDDILDLSKVEAGKLIIDPQPFSLERMLRDLSVILSAYVGAKPIDVLFDVDSALPECLVADSPRLQQVLLNLSGNAVKFTAQGEVVVRLRELERTDDNVRVEFCVQDTGIGIAPENLERIFHSFSQAEASTTRKFGGTGLGLAISRHLVDLMGGRIELASQPGTGSRFFFALTLPIVHEVPPELRRISHGTAQPRKVLVVDDNPEACALIARMTQSWNWPTETAQSGREALQRVQSLAERDEQPYHLILVDWHMPDMDGWETVQQLREDHARRGGPRPVIVMLTNQSRETLAQRTHEEQAQIDGFLVKPFTAGMLQESALDGDAAEARVRSPRNAEGRRRRLKGLRVLVVEDNLINQQVAEELLIAEGALVSLAANGQLGVDAVAAASPQFDVVLMDLQMPILDGYAATRVIREQLGLTTLPIVAMTANAMSSDREECLAAGMTEHVGKPFNITRLVNLLLSLTGRDLTGAPPPAATMEPEPTPPPSPPAAQEPVQAQTPPQAGSDPAIDLAAALERMEGAVSLYLMVARETDKEMPDMVAQYRQAVQEDRSKAGMQMHSAKGVAGLIGARLLAEECARLEKLCKTGASVEELLAQADSLSAIVERTRAELAKVMLQLADQEDADVAPPASAPTTPALSPAALLDALNQLIPLLAASDLSVIQRYEALRPQLEKLDEADFKPLDEALRGFDLARALQCCKALRDRHQQAST